MFEPPLHTCLSCRSALSWRLSRDILHPECALASAVQIPDIGRAVAPLSPPRQSVQALAVLSLPAVLSPLSPPRVAYRPPAPLWAAASRSCRRAPSPPATPTIGRSARPLARTRVVPWLSDSPEADAPGLIGAILRHALDHRELPEIASVQTGLADSRAEPQLRLDAYRAGWLARPAISGIGQGRGCARCDVAVVDPGRLRAAPRRPPADRVFVDRGPSCMCSPTADRRRVSAPLALSPPILQHPRACACLVSMSCLPAGGLVRTMRRPWCICKNVYCIELVA
jgi:hypothetical protein